MSETTTGSDMERDEVERRLGATLQAKAEQVVVGDDAFDPAQTMVSDTVEFWPRRSRRVIVAIVTTVAVAAAAAGIALATRPHTHADGVSTESTVPTDPTAPASVNAGTSVTAPLLAPAWVPDGEQLWSMNSGHWGLPLGHPSDLAVQLFGTKGADGSLTTGLLFRFYPVTGNSPATDQTGGTAPSIGSGTPITVRGRPGVTRPSKYEGEARILIEWIEGGADIQASVRGATVEQAVAAIDALRARSNDDLMQGFDAAADAGQYPLIGEQAHTVTTGVVGSFDYAAAAPAGDAQPDYSVQTFASDSTDPGYLAALAGGRVESDGTAVEWVPDFGFTVAWPDGRGVNVTAASPNPDLAVLERIGRSAVLLDEPSAVALSDGAAARVAALPLLGTAHLAAGDLELHGADTAPAVCLLEQGAAVACSDPFKHGGANQGGENVVPGGASAVIGGQWYVFVGAPAKPSFDAFPAGYPSVTPTTNQFGEGSPPPALSPEIAQIGDTYVGLVVVPDAVTVLTISVRKDGTDSSTGLSFTRPDA